ncbi:MAG: long-chain fatty acid--CoA ligase [Alcaligenaceae bacterium]|nr:long-chain fatty acid--CoA ligase [Alcaligenaceae bacterium]
MQATELETLRSARAEQPVQRTMMDIPLRVTDVMDRAERLFPEQQVISRYTPERIVCETYGELGLNARRLASALRTHGIKPGMRVASLMWNHGSHLSAYYAIPGIDAVLHTLNPRLSPEELAYIVADAGDAAVLIDDDLLPLWTQVSRHVQVPVVIVHQLSGQPATVRQENVLYWHELIAEAAPLPHWPTDPIDEKSPVAICYTSGTTGRPKGVVYSHRSILLHGLVVATPDAFNISGRDTLLTLTPMFHVNAWSMPYTAVMLGTRQVLAGPRPTSEEIVDLMDRENVTTALGVPTLWAGILDTIEKNPGRWKLKNNVRICSGGAAPPPEMFRRFDRLGMRLSTGWGMTETSPMGSLTWLKSSLDNLDYEAQLEIRTSNGIALPLIDMRHVDSAGNTLPWDGASMGELQVRGPWVTQAYIGHPNPIPATSTDGWLKTGDIVTFQPNGYLKLVDRLKDLVKSGGEWISSVDMENALCDHPFVAEAAVIAVPDDKWGERPLAIVALKAGTNVASRDIQTHLLTRFPKWMVPEHIKFMEQLPRTGVGKLNKVALRKQFS